MWLKKHINNSYYVLNYIAIQEEHHAKKTFKEEYIDYLKKFEVNYKDQYLFDWLE